MAHEIAKTQDGRDAMIWFGDTPWHRLGTQIPEERRRDLRWALETAGINFGVEKVPHYVRLEDGTYIQSKDSFSVLRTDNNHVVGTVGSFWHPLQNSDAFAPLQPVLDDGLASIESGGVLRDGKQVWMLVQFDTDTIIRVAHERSGDDPDKREEFKRLVAMIEKEHGGGILPYGLFSNDHSGRGKARIKETMIRVVCANTLDWSLGQEETGFSLEVTHHSRVKQDYQEAADQMFGNLVERYVTLANFREILKTTYLPEDAFQELVLDVAVPVIHLERKIQRREATAQTPGALERASEKRLEIRRLWNAGDGHDGDGSAWEAWQGVVQWVDHNPDAYSDKADRVQSLTDGSLNRIKRQTLRGLLHFAKETAGVSAN